jgi:hypothetical protein
VSKYLVRRTKPPSQSWRVFLNNHLWDRLCFQRLCIGPIEPIPRQH